MNSSPFKIRKRHQYRAESRYHKKELDDERVKEME